MLNGIEWKEEYSVGVEEIDDQHKDLIGLILDLFNAINEKKTKEQLGEILKDLIEFADTHFSTEEKYFEEFDYENKEEHAKEHRDFAAKVIGLNEKYENNEIEISFELIDFLEDWLLDHLIEQDQKYKECFAKHGLK